MKAAARRKTLRSRPSALKAEPGRPVIDTERCDGCRVCVEKCPNQALVVADRAGCGKCIRYCAILEVPCVPIVIRVLADRCDGCGSCVEACPLGAIEMKTPLRPKRR